uniref:Deacetylase sirtuin-type domain-containing protein n=2 Tax=gambiae species complex TaxID=44542 RepID=A0A8W7PQ41_ANOCL
MFVPAHEPAHESDCRRLEKFLEDKPHILVLTGAGISTESGIPDYRSEGVGLYARSNHKPIQHGDFVKSEATRKRYWARNYVGWPRFSSIAPNVTHYTLARLEREGRISGIVTQNVDRLHGKAGSKQVIELHGSGFDCGGNLKPEIVFFGDNVPMPRIEKVVRMIIESDGVLVLGSSLTVFSGYRIILQAKELGLPVAIVNIGATRGDPKADLKISARCGEVMANLFKPAR